MAKYKGRKLIASYTACGQTGPDSWETYIETLFITPETKISEIMDWYHRREKLAKRIVNIQINEPDQEVQNGE